MYPIVHEVDGIDGADDVDGFEGAEEVDDGVEGAEDVVEMRAPVVTIRDDVVSLPMDEVEAEVKVAVVRADVVAGDLMLVVIGIGLVVLAGRTEPVVIVMAFPVLDAIFNGPVVVVKGVETWEWRY